MIPVFSLIIYFFHFVSSDRAIGKLSVLNCPWSLGCTDCAICDVIGGINCGHNFGSNTTAKRPSGESSFLFTFAGLPSNGALNGVRITIARTYPFPLGDRNITDVGYGASLTIGGANSTNLHDDADWPYGVVKNATYGNYSYLWGFNRITGYEKIQSAGLILNYQFKTTGDRSAPGIDTMAVQAHIDCLTAEIEYSVLIQTKSSSSSSSTTTVATTIKTSSNPTATITTSQTTVTTPTKSITLNPTTSTRLNLTAISTVSATTATSKMFNCSSISNCNNGGVCIDMNICKCFEDFIVASMLGCRRKSNATDCSHLSNCNGGGRCVGEANEIGRCQCDDGYADDNSLGCRRFIGTTTVAIANTTMSAILTKFDSIVGSGFPIDTIVGIIIGCLLLIGGIVAMIVVIVKKNRDNAAAQLEPIKLVNRYDFVPSREPQYGETTLSNI